MCEGEREREREYLEQDKVDKKGLKENEAIERMRREWCWKKVL
jgi:hypothetical protein